MAGTAAVASIFSTVMGIQSTQEAARDQRAAAAEAERIGQENAVAIEAETREQSRRTSLEQQATEATARAIASASGTKGGSLETVMDTMSVEHARQLDWIQISGTTKAEQAISAGEYAGMTGMAQASATEAGGVAGFLSGVGTSFTMGSKAGWWS